MPSRGCSPAEPAPSTKEACRWGRGNGLLLFSSKTVFCLSAGRDASDVGMPPAPSPRAGCGAGEARGASAGPGPLSPSAGRWEGVGGGPRFVAARRPRRGRKRQGNPESPPQRVGGPRGRGTGSALPGRWPEPAPAAGPKAAADRSRHISSFLTWVPFFSSLSTAHFISASLHHRSICNVNRETQGSFSFGLVYGRIPRGIQNVLTQINGTNKSKISLAT